MTQYKGRSVQDVSMRADGTPNQDLTLLKFFCDKTTVNEVTEANG